MSKPWWWLDSEAAAASPISNGTGDEQGAAACDLCGRAWLEHGHVPGVGNELCPPSPAVDKLLAHDEYAKAAVQYLRDWLRDEPEPLLAMARGRHAEGHYRYGDRLMFEYGQDELVAEAAQEVADAICYIALLLKRAR